MENEESSAAAPAKLSEGIAGWVESIIVTVSQTSLGQKILKLVDRFLWVVEKSAQWSLPYQEIAAEENGKTFGKMELVRPLPWILFLPGLVILRAIKVGLNIGAFILGYPQIQPSGMVKFVQKSRRRLRALNLKAVKNIRRKNCSAKDKRLSMIEAKKALIRSIRLTLSTLSCLDTSKSSPSPPPTKIRIGGIDFDATATPDEKSTTESAGSPMHTDAKRKFSEVSTEEESTDESENETLASKIERLAMDDSTDDPDFNPADCSTESSSGSSENEGENMNVSLGEIVDVNRDAKSFLNEKVEKKPVVNEVTPAEKTSNVETCVKADRVVGPQICESLAYHPPNKFGQDGDAAFYSPISSNSGSPERSISPCIEREPQVSQSLNKTKNFSNGEVNFRLGPVHSGASTEEVSNGVVSEKRNTNIGKFHHKGKRSSHGNRKKK